MTTVLFLPIRANPYVKAVRSLIAAGSVPDSPRPLRVRLLHSPHTRTPNGRMTARTQHCYKTCSYSHDVSWIRRRARHTSPAVVALRSHVAPDTRARKQHDLYTTTIKLHPTIHTGSPASQSHPEPANPSQDGPFSEENKLSSAWYSDVGSFGM